MRSVFIILTMTLIFISCRTPEINRKSMSAVYPDNMAPSDHESLQSIRIINNTSIQSLFGVAKDLSIVLNDSGFQKKFPLGSEGLTIFLQDLLNRNFTISASVMVGYSNSVFNVGINTLNRQAEDRALAATLIHEVMHCVLLNIYRRAVENDQNALKSVTNFGLGKNPAPNFIELMKEGESGSHELMSCVFHSEMVQLLESFGGVHRQMVRGKEADYLMWSGLQKTIAYKRLSDDKRYDIEFAILKAKGIEID